MDPAVLFAVWQTGARANGGVESITQIIERLRRVRPLVVTQLETAATERWRRAGAHVEVWPVPYRMGEPLAGNGARWRRLSSIVETNARAAALVSARGARVVHCNDLLALSHVGPGARAAGARLVHQVRGLKAPGEPYRWPWKLAARACDVQLCLSHEMAGALRRAGLRSRRVECIYSAAEPQAALTDAERGALRARLGIDAAELAIGYVAAVCPTKAQAEFLEEAAPALLQAAPRARVHFLGDLPGERDLYAVRCREAAARLGDPARVCFHGYRDDVRDWYRALDVVVLASRYEGLARCMIESLAAGTPVVSFAVCSAREVLEEHGGGCVVPIGDYAALVRAVLPLAADASLARGLGARGRRTAAELFAPAAVVERHELLYLELAGHDVSLAGAAP